MTHHVLQVQKEGKLYLMTVKLFLLGLPGSGKSTVARYIQEYVKGQNYLARRFNDYGILQEMFRNDAEHKFKPADGGGFDVLDLTVFDTALERLEHEVKRYTSSEKSEEITLIEFARADYQHAFRQFSKEFLQNQDTYFLYLAAELNICKERIQNRTANPTFEDDFYVSEYIFEKYYRYDAGQYLSAILKREYQINQQQLRIINNNNSLEVASTEINAFVDFIIARAPLGHRHSRYA
jgi:shikimate kinase